MTTTEKKYTILYVDDEESNLRIFKTAFKRYYKIHIATSAALGLELLKQEEVHLIVTDQKMPKMTGVQFLAELLHEHPKPVRIILTGFSDMNAIIDAINVSHVYRYVTKPWDKWAMKKVIDDALEVFQQEEDITKHISELQAENEELYQKISSLKK
jgi:response regulator RpfG family c-di-GMP phosphodiesterase